MNEKLVEVPSLDALRCDLSKIDALPMEVAKTLWLEIIILEKAVGMRALMGPQNGQGEDELLTVPEVAQRLKLSLYRTYELCRQGVLKSVRLGKSVRVRPSAVAEYLAKQGA